MRYRQAILDALAHATRPLAHRDLRAIIDPDASDPSAFNGIALDLTYLHRAGLVSRERIDHRYHYRVGRRADTTEYKCDQHDSALRLIAERVPTLVGLSLVGAVQALIRADERRPWLGEP